MLILISAISSQLRNTCSAISILIFTLIPSDLWPFGFFFQWSTLQTPSSVSNAPHPSLPLHDSRLASIQKWGGGVSTAAPPQGRSWYWESFELTKGRARSWTQSSCPCIGHSYSCFSSSPLSCPKIFLPLYYHLPGSLCQCSIIVIKRSFPSKLQTEVTGDQKDQAIVLTGLISQDLSKTLECRVSKRPLRGPLGPLKTWISFAIKH